MSTLTNCASSPVVFNFSDSTHPIRVILRDGDPWFVAKDVADALDYIWNTAKTIDHIPEEWKGRIPIPTLGGLQEMHVISEPGLYFFLGRSDKPKALPFQKWLAGEVLPSIRRTGSYTAPKPVGLLMAVKIRVKMAKKDQDNSWENRN